MCRYVNTTNVTHLFSNAQNSVRVPFPVGEISVAVPLPSDLTGIQETQKLWNIYKLQ